MGTPTGGNPGTIAAGADGLRAAAAAVGTTSKGITSSGSQAAGAAGDARLTAAINRFAAAWSQTTTDLDTQMRAAAMLARNGANDLAVAGGERPR